MVDDSIENAAARGIAARFLSAEEANTEREILLHFAPKLKPLLRQRQTDITAIEEQLISERARLKPLLVRMARFAKVKNPPIVTVFLVANPNEHNGGGGAYGGRLVVEVPLPDTIGTLLHESLHQLSDPQEQRIQTTAKATGLDYNALSEGIAYTLYPGIMANTEEISVRCSGRPWHITKR